MDYGTEQTDNDSLHRGNRYNYNVRYGHGVFIEELDLMFLLYIGRLVGVVSGKLAW